MPEEKNEDMPAEKPEEKAAKETEKGEEEEKAQKAAEPEKKPEKRAEKGSLIRIVRVGGRDLDGNLPVKRALNGVRGVSFMLANAIAKTCGFGDKKVGDLSEDELKKIEDMLAHPGKYGVPAWLFNRRFDPADGQDKHMISGRLELMHKMDINELKKRKCYRGIRHIIGLPVRGQRTRSSFRHAATVGVSRAKQRPGSKRK